MEITPIQAIRKFCLECMGSHYDEIKACSRLDCPLWAFRLGIHPYTSKNISNPFLQASYFQGLGNRTTSEVIEIINKKGGPDSRIN